MPNLENSLLGDALGDLPGELAARVESIAKAYFAVEMGLRELTEEVSASQKRPAVAVEELQSWTLRAKQVQVLRDRTNADLDALADDLETRGLLEKHGPGVRGLLEVFVETADAASREFEASVTAAAAAQFD